MKESDLSKKLAKQIRDAGGWARKTHGGPTMAGWPDIVAVYRGYPIFLEVKLPGKESTLTKNQANTLKELKAAGAIAAMVASGQQVQRILDKIDKVRDE